MLVEAFQIESYSFSMPTAPQLAMAQEQLRDVWLRAQHGRLCAWEQAKALALREVSREIHGRTQLEWIAARVEKAGGGHPRRYVTSSLMTSSRRDARSHPRAIPEPSEAPSESRSMAVSLQTSSKRNARSHPGAIGGCGRIAKYAFIVADKL